MIVQVRINTGFVKDGGRGSVWESIKLNEHAIKEFDLKRRTLDEEKSLEEFIVEDLTSLINNELEDGLYGLFNY